MAWTSPRTWTVGEMFTHTLGNTHIRDNLLALSTHTHTGAAGDGDDELSGVDHITYDDASAPAAPGASLTRLYAVAGVWSFRAGAAGASTGLSDENHTH